MGVVGRMSVRKERGTGKRQVGADEADEEGRGRNDGSKEGRGEPGGDCEYESEYECCRGEDEGRRWSWQGWRCSPETELVKASTEQHAARKVRVQVPEGEKKGAVEKRTDIEVGYGIGPEQLKLI